MPYVNDTSVEVLISAADQLRAVLTGLELGLPVDQTQLEACAVNLFTIVNVLAGLKEGSVLEPLQRLGPQLAEEEACDTYLRAASEQLPAGRPHVVLIGSRIGRAPYLVSNVPPLMALELLERAGVKITTLQGVARRVEDVSPEPARTLPMRLFLDEDLDGEDLDGEDFDDGE
ncbi:MAG TPA: hypothetical protein VJN18_11180 [Polyangiaceae bacterium]|nr:hypothetical protein [Polyangiaceae bacterium]